MIKPVNKKLSDLMDIDLRYWNYGPCEELIIEQLRLVVEEEWEGMGEKERGFSLISLFVLCI